jgi:hypothetical protein
MENTQGTGIRTGAGGAKIRGPSAEEHSRRADGGTVAGARHTVDPSVNTEGSSRANAQAAVPPDGVPCVSKVTDAHVAKGCVLLCLNRILRGHGLPEATAADLRRFLPTIVESARRQNSCASVFGPDNLLGDIHEDEAVVLHLSMCW